MIAVAQSRARRRRGVTGRPLRAARAMLPVALCLTLSGPLSCARRGETFSPPAGAPGAFSMSGKAPMPARWWTAFDDADLNALIDRALAGNLNLQSTWDRLEQARAAARAGAAEMYPGATVEGAASRTRTVTLSRAGGGAKHRDVAYANSFSLGLVASYEVDLWGRVRSTRDAAELDLRASREDLSAAAITLAAEVAGTWYRLVDQRGQITLLDDQIRTNRDYLELVTLRFRRGQVPATDVLQQQQLLESTRAEKVQAESGRKVLEHQLAVLLGRSPGAGAGGPVGALPELPPLPDTGLPAELIRRRPDLRGAYLRVQAADRRVAAAIADRFPRISLSARAETSAAQMRDLFDNWLASIAANLTAPLFDGGLREAEVDRTRAAASEWLHVYGQTVLEALRDVEDALVREARQREYLASVDQQLDLSRKVIDQTRDRYVKGAMDYLRVLAALQSHQRLQRARLRGKQELIQFRINLYRALGGAWDMRRGRIVGKAPTEEKKHAGQ